MSEGAEAAEAARVGAAEAAGCSQSPADILVFFLGRGGAATEAEAAAAAACMISLFETRSRAACNCLGNFNDKAVGWPASGLVPVALEAA